VLVELAWEDELAPPRRFDDITEVIGWTDGSTLAGKIELAAALDGEAEDCVDELLVADDDV